MASPSQPDAARPTTENMVRPIDGREVMLNEEVRDCYSGKVQLAECTLKLIKSAAGEWQVRVCRRCHGI